MPLNLLKNYSALLELSVYKNEFQRRESLMRIFKRDFVESGDIFFYINKKKIGPTPSSDGKIKVETLFTHLTCEVENKQERNRVYDNNRAVRLHWVRHLLLGNKAGLEVFSVEEKEGKKTYIYDKEEQYVIVLEPLRNKNEYYLLTAYKLTGKDAKRDKIMAKKKRALEVIL